jgi:transcriptional regulator with XRE-family HTH domain
MGSLQAFLKGKIREKGYTIKQFANLLGMTDANYYAKYKDNSWRLSQLEKICEVLDMELADLFPSKKQATQKNNELKTYLQIEIPANRQDEIIKLVTGK